MLPTGSMILLVCPMIDCGYFLTTLFALGLCPWSCQKPGVLASDQNAATKPQSEFDDLLNAVHSGMTKDNQLEAEFDRLLLPYTEFYGTTTEDIDDDLAELREKMVKLRNKGRHNTPNGKQLQRHISDFERLIKLRDLIVKGHAGAGRDTKDE